MMKWIAVAALAVLCACSKTNAPDEGSQTHFLASCEGSCPAPYDCVCGVCTVPCDANQACAGQADGAACLDSACSESATVCDVECADDDACAQLGSRFSCEDGRCREPIVSDAGESGAGAGGSGGMGGTGGVGVTGGSGGSVATLDEICDGSTDMRLGLTSEGGQVEPTYELTNPYGHSFFFIDGQCRFYASSSYQEGIYTGTFSQAGEEELMRDVAWDRLAELAAAPEVESCPDAGESSIWAPGYRASCTCGCDEGPLMAEKEAAINASFPLIQNLNEEGMGEFLTTPILAVAQEVGPASGTEKPWPLERAVTSIAGLVLDLSMGGPIEPVRFDDAQEAAALRALRSPDPFAGQLQVQDAGVAYLIFMRDAFPAGVEAKIDALRRSPMRSAERNPDEQALLACDADEPCGEAVAELIDGSRRSVLSLGCVIDALMQRTPGRYRYLTDSIADNTYIGADHVLLVQDDETVLYTRVPHEIVDGVPTEQAETALGQRCVLFSARFFAACSAALEDPTSDEAWACAFGNGTATTPSELDWFQSCEDASPLSCE